MSDVFDKLRTLQEILSKKYEIEQEIEELPEELATKTELLNRLKRSFIDKSESYESSTNRIKSLRTRLADAESTRERYEQQMDLIKTQREYEALDKEIKDASEKEQELRRELQREEQNLLEMKTNIQNEEMMIKEQEEEIKSEQSRIKLLVKEKRDFLTDLEREETEITPDLDEEILFKFERIIRSKSGLGIVPIRNSVCTGCYMCLTPQYVNDVRLGQGIKFCPYCSRILFYTDEEEIDEFDELFLEDNLEDDKIDDENDDIDEDVSGLDSGDDDFVDDEDENEDEDNGEEEADDATEEG